MNMCLFSFQITVERGEKSVHVPKSFSSRMAAWLAELVMTIALVIAGSVVADPEDTMQRVWRDDYSDEEGSPAAQRSGLLCPCTQGCCDEGWFQYKDACYLPITDQAQNWFTAKDHCGNVGAHLASIHSDEEQNFIFHLMGKRKDYWIGAEKTNDPTELWKWTDNSAWDYYTFARSLDVEDPRSNLAVDRNDGIQWIYVHKHHLGTYVCKYLLD
ncbi:snaclec EMS16 subunit beta-like [Rhineura floridana]|uniref:snaclec EMS16 subunit beta-like n=1 Tax=Rhineura floridana TaxID=261503 RepID=UPI002AC87868|nr:snaclec EMS16 subunit beta-like [Rhineura floridana]